MDQHGYPLALSESDRELIRRKLSLVEQWHGKYTTMDNFPFIRTFFELLDARMERLVAEMKAFKDPDGFGLP